MKGDISFTGTLTRVLSKHENLRTDSVVGSFSKFPTVGESFCLIAAPFNPEDPDNNARLILTTPVLKTWQTTLESTSLFVTENSVYSLKEEEA